ncbi:MAG: hypothetical protein KDC43_20345 [Saprospiraceae bacterium]|nr:hypothetical protein [Saprospiraceae bacterium]MCB0626196.1 hypothetical protein [Saprospiraceae bacterium]MCB0679123.1 hypothetical protein [Saprospiraceae bacterium]MCB0683133.1 hypothetical protein [Saprospiraceae bacterium]
MKEGVLTPDKDQTLIARLVEKVVQPKGYDQIRVNSEGYDMPAEIKSQESDKVFVPDATAMRNGRKNYFELGLKTDRVRPLITKWKLLSNLARFRGGKLFLVVPRGHHAFVKRILRDYPVEAKVVKI